MRRRELFRLLGVAAVSALGAAASALPGAGAGARPRLLGAATLRVEPGDLPADNFPALRPLAPVLGEQAHWVEGVPVKRRLG